MSASAENACPDEVHFGGAISSTVAADVRIEWALGMRAVVVSVNSIVQRPIGLIRPGGFHQGVRKPWNLVDLSCVKAGFLANNHSSIPTSVGGIPATRKRRQCNGGSNLRYSF